MSQVFVLIPGLLLPESAKKELTADAEQALAPLFSQLAQDPMRQDLAHGVDEGSAHLLWAWAVITRKPFPIACAPYRWLIAEAPETATELWHLTLAHRDEKGALQALPAAPAAHDLDTLCERLRPTLDQAGFWLQRWDDALYLSRKKDWAIRTRPWAVLAGHAVRNSDWEGEPDAVAAAQELINTLEEKLVSPDPISAGNCTVNALWIHGGGRQRLFFPPTLLRSVLADDAAITGWGQAAGILNFRTGKAAGVTSWPQDCPRGDCLAVLNDLYEPWLKQDWGTWRTKLPQVVAQAQALVRDANQAKGCEQSLIVATGRCATLSLAAKVHNKPLSLLARLARRGTTANPADWIFEDAS